MDWRLVRQPNGLLARFSLTAHDFTHMQMGYDEAVDVCVQEGGTKDQSMSQVERADNDLKGPWPKPKFVAAGGQRWHAALQDIQDHYGSSARRARQRIGRQFSYAGIVVIQRTAWEMIVTGRTERDFPG